MGEKPRAISTARKVTLGTLVTVITLVTGILTFLWTNNIVSNPFVRPPTATATPNIRSLVVMSPKCDKSTASDWIVESSNTADAFTCINEQNTQGTVLTQDKGSNNTAEIRLSLPAPGYAPTRDYGLSVDISRMSPPHTCAGLSAFFYSVFMCSDGTWLIAQYYEASGVPSKVATGTYNASATQCQVTDTTSCTLSLQISNNTLRASIGAESLGSVQIDPNVPNTYVSITVDALPLGIDSKQNPGGSALFSQFVFAPLY